LNLDLFYVTVLNVNERFNLGFLSETANLTKGYFFHFFPDQNVKISSFVRLPPQKNGCLLSLTSFDKANITLSVFVLRRKSNQLFNIFISRRYLTILNEFLHSFTSFLFQSSDQVNYFPVL
jgi:hypothetical protein